MLQARRILNTNICFSQVFHDKYSHKNKPILPNELHGVNGWMVQFQPNALASILSGYILVWLSRHTRTFISSTAWICCVTSFSTMPSFPNFGDDHGQHVFYCSEKKNRLQISGYIINIMGSLKYQTLYLNNKVWHSSRVQICSWRGTEAVVRQIE